MRIIAEECSGCGKCITECHRGAIREGPDGMPTIDEELCDGCNGLFDAQCARVCPGGCIAKPARGSEIERIIPDGVVRLRPDHLLYAVAILGSGNNGRYVGGREWDVQRDIIAKAFRDTTLEIRIVPVFDDACVGCAMKKDPAHRDRLSWEDNRTLNALRLEYGQKIRFWDAVKTARRTITAEYLKSIMKTEDFIEDFLNSPFAGLGGAANQSGNPA